ncbi:RDD family protein [Melittangium boletus]|uniref:RDD family protein n=1 Tax=Melittangium boletus DSM 14713 TaxID=1294270 RepID=A0A250IIZ7_9BACT|nr:RDD family protein [Melittangium boletus]ATB31132.1 RDD family protein [Melittangium boletus DSM 14713]
MSKCLKCGAALPPVGECPACAAASQPASRAVPAMLDREIHIDRRRSERDASEVPTLPGEQALPPGMIARPATPPGMLPAPRPQTPAPPTVRNVAPMVPAPRPPPAAVARPGVAAPSTAPQASPAVMRQPGAPGLPVMPPRAAPAPGLPVFAPEAPEEEASFSVDVDEDAPDTLPLHTAAPVSPVPTPAPTPTARQAAPAPAKAKPAPAPEAASGEVHARPASLWRRLLAFSIDTGAIAGIVALYLLLASSVAGVHKSQTTLTGLDAFLLQVRALQSVLIPGIVLLLVLSLVYCAVSAFLWNGRTLGRRLLGLRLVDTRGMAPAPGRAVVRALLASVSFGFFLAGFWMALFDRRGQTLHDKLTSTYVVQPS